MYLVICMYLLGLVGGEKPSLKQQSTKLNCDIGFILVLQVFWRWYSALELAVF